MRISDWSSDVCSSDLIDGHRRAKIFSPAYNYAFLPRAVFCGATYSNARVVKLVDAGDSKSPAARRAGSIPAPGTSLKYRSDERRVGNGFVSTCKSRWSPNH